MHDFFDTGLIIGTSYIININYRGLSPSIIDTNASECHKRFITPRNKIICTTVHYELIDVLRRRKKMHEILLLELKGVSEKRLNKAYSEFYNLTTLYRDTKWLIDMTGAFQRLAKEHGLKKINHIIHDILTHFELNILAIIDSVTIFDPKEKTKYLNMRRKIKAVIDNLIKREKEPPHWRDIVIFSNAITYHNENEESDFVTVDTKFRTIEMGTLQSTLTTQKIVSEVPELVVIES